MRGVYVYGKSEKRTTLVEGRLRKSYGHGKPVDQWDVMLKEHHEAYIDWGEFERNQKQLAVNATVEWAVRSPGAVIGPCSRGCCAVEDAGGVWWWRTQGAAYPKRCTGVIAPTYPDLMSSACHARTNLLGGRRNFGLGTRRHCALRTIKPRLA